MEHKINLAIEFLKNGKSFSLGDLLLSIDSSKSLTVMGFSSYQFLTNLTTNIALQELADVKFNFSQLLNASAELKLFSDKKLIKYVLSYDDYGKSSIYICEESNGILSWNLEFDRAGKFIF